MPDQTPLAHAVSVKLGTLKVWDVVVVGAGPAGAFASYLLAQQGLSVLLIEKTRFPRKKVCGSCLSHAAVSLLEENGLGNILREYHAPPLHEFFLASGGPHAVIKMPEGAALSREVLDAALVKKAQERGAQFFAETLAFLEKKASEKDPFHQIKLFQDQQETLIQAKIILSADGLGGQFLEKEEGFEMVTDPASHIGVGKIFEESPDFYQSGIIYMATSAEGYAGLVRLEDGRLNIAAALDASFLKKKGTGRAVKTILEKNQFPLMDGIEENWQGTYPLTRQRKCAAGCQMFVIGDAAGYVEPFTGEGIAAALQSAKNVTGFVAEGTRNWNSHLEIQWQELYHRQMQERQTRCKMITRFLRNPLLTRAAVHFLSWFPETASPIVQEITT